MAYDSARRRVVLRGGGTPSRTAPHDTWEWDGGVWRQAVGDGPPSGGGYRMAYDAARARTVLFGGRTSLWNGSAWMEQTTTPTPAARSVHALAYDPRRERVVLYGGTVDQVDASDTWEWDGTRWTAFAAM